MEGGSQNKNYIRNCIQAEKQSHDKSEGCLNNLLPTQALNTVCIVVVRAINKVEGNRTNGKTKFKKIKTH